MSGVTGREVKGLAFAKFGTNSWGVAASVTKGTYFQSDGGMTFAEIGKALGISRNEACAIYHRAIRKLAKAALKRAEVEGWI